MKRLLAGLLVPLVLAACGDDTTGPDNRVVIDEAFVGDWLGLLDPASSPNQLTFRLVITQTESEGAQGDLAIDFSPQGGSIVSTPIAEFRIDDPGIRFAPAGTGEWWVCRIRNDELEGIVESADGTQLGLWTAFRDSPTP
jgi:hypothetical protein